MRFVSGANGAFTENGGGGDATTLDERLLLAAVDDAFALRS